MKIISFLILTSILIFGCATSKVDFKEDTMIKSGLDGLVPLQVSLSPELEELVATTSVLGSKIEILVGSALKRAFKKTDTSQVKLELINSEIDTLTSDVMLIGTNFTCFYSITVSFVSKDRIEIIYARSVGNSPKAAIEDVVLEIYHQVKYLMKLPAASGWSIQRP